MLKRLPSLLEIVLLPLAVIALLRWQRHEQETLCDAYMQTEYSEIMHVIMVDGKIDRWEDKLTA
jgi:hypothetical protein